MTRSRGEFDTRHDGERDAPDDSDDRLGDTGPVGGLDAVQSWLSFHRVEFLLVCLVGVGGILLPVVFGLGALVLGPGGAVSETIRTFFWVTVLVGIPLLALSLYVHAAVDLYRVGLADGEIATWGRVLFRSVQTASALAFALGVQVMLNETTPDAEFDPAALLSAFLLIVGLAGMVVSVALDGLLRLFHGTW